MSLLGWSQSPPKKRSATYKGTRFEIFVENVFRYCGDYSSILRNTVFRIKQDEASKKNLYSSQIDICCRLDPRYNRVIYLKKHRYGLFELKYSSASPVDEGAVNQLLSSCDSLAKEQQYVGVEPMAVVTNKVFTSGARKLAEEHNLKLIDGEELDYMYRLASEKHKRELDDMYGRASERSDSRHFISKLVSKLFSNPSDNALDDAALDEKIKSVVVRGHRTAPCYVDVTA